MLTTETYPSDPFVAVNPSFEHLKALLGPAGVVQFARGSAPDLGTGTCLDDNVRAWIVAVLALRNDPEQPYARQIGDMAATFVRRAERPDGLFRNFADFSGAFLEDIGSEASNGRTIWACGVVAATAPIAEWRRDARAVLKCALPAVRSLRSRHARAYALLGLAAAAAPALSTSLSADDAIDPALRNEIFSALQHIADGLADNFDGASSPQWSWFSDHLTWASARLPEAMLRAAAVSENPRYAKVGLRSLEFLAGVTQNDSLFVPIGNQGWYMTGSNRAVYDQQPIEATAMVDAWLAAYGLTGDEAYRAGAEVAFDWFHGGNTERLAVARTSVGACHDGLQIGHVNENQGAESTLSYLHAQLSIGRLRRGVTQLENLSAALAQDDADSLLRCD